MPKIKLSYSRQKVLGKVDPTKTFTHSALKIADFDGFTTNVLGIGDVGKEGAFIQSLAVFFDLEGFTDFSVQPESHLVIPDFLSRYLNWLFEKIRSGSEHSRNSSHVILWGGLPFYAKFMGDGVLFLWDSASFLSPVALNNTIRVMADVRESYQSEFLPSIKSHVSSPPRRLRCGIARGQIVSIGGGADYVGPCINIASRLQKISGLSFAVSRRGIDLNTHSFGKKLLTKKITVRSVGAAELVYVLATEFNALPASQKSDFQEP